LTDLLYRTGPACRPYSMEGLKEDRILRCLHYLPTHSDHLPPAPIHITCLPHYLPPWDTCPPCPGPWEHMPSSIMVPVCLHICRAACHLHLTYPAIPAYLCTFLLTIHYDNACLPVALHRFGGTYLTCLHSCLPACHTLPAAACLGHARCLRPVPLYLPLYLPYSYMVLRCHTVPTPTVGVTCHHYTPPPLHITSTRRVFTTGDDHINTLKHTFIPSYARYCVSHVDIVLCSAADLVPPYSRLYRFFPWDTTILYYS